MHSRYSLFFLVTLLDCDGTTTTGPNLQPVAAEFRVAPLTATLAGQVSSIDAQLGRDFMPVLGPEDSNGRPLVAVVQQASSLVNPPLTVIAPEGPKWEPLERVDVVARLSDGAGRVAYVRVVDPLTRDRA